MLKSSEIAEIQELVQQSLDSAEGVWATFGERMTCFSNEAPATNRKIAEAIETHIPGYDKIEEGQPQMDDFIAIVADMRDSTKHLTQAISGDVSMIQRVYYETSALIPAVAKSILFEGGKVTEYLGDGVLGLIQASKELLPDSIYAAHRAAENCLDAVDRIVNTELKKRYSLPPISIGVGLSFSQALVTVIGTNEHKAGKVFGQCVYHATKLSGGRNEIAIDSALNRLWPKEKGGVLHFRPKKIKDIDGWIITK